MANPVAQQLVVFAMGCLTGGTFEIEQPNSATLEWNMTEQLPTQSTIFAGAAFQHEGSCDGLAFRALASIALRDSRSLEQWEKRATDEFFWSQFS